MPDHPRPFSDYIVYVDESGDPALTGVDAEFPMFGLAFCIFRVSDYIDAVVPAMQRLKFRHWGMTAPFFTSMKSGSVLAIIQG